MEKLNAIKSRQVELIGTKGLKATLENLKLALQSLTIARSADTMIIHLENTKDVSKFRAFLSIVPGGIRGLAEILPAAGVVFSLGRIGIEGLKKESGVDGEKGESFLDVLMYTFIPVYGTGNFLWSKTVNLREFLEKGKVPPITDLAVTTTIGTIALIEVKRVFTGLANIINGDVVKGLKKLTYIDDIAKSSSALIRGVRNVAALATRPVLRPELVKTIATIATKAPKKGRLAIAGVLLAGLAGGVAYAMGEDSSEDIQEKYRKDGYIDSNNNPTEKLKNLFYQKSLTDRKEILDALLVLHEGSTDHLPRTHLEEGKYSLVEYTKKSSIIDSPFRQSLQSLGIDIDFV